MRRLLAHPALPGAAMGMAFLLAFRFPAPSGLGFHEALGGWLLPMAAGWAVGRRTRLGWTWLGLGLAFLLCFSWLPATLAAKAPMPLAAGWGCALLFVGWEALGLSVLTALSGLLHRRRGPLAAALGGAALLALWERFGFHVYPWSLGAAFGGVPILARSAAFLGTYGLAALAWGTGLWCGLALAEGRRGPRAWAPPAAALVLLGALGGAWGLLPRGPRHTLDAVLVQPNFVAGERRPGMEEAAWDLTDPVLRQSGLPRPGTPTLVLWPESSVLGRNDAQPSPRHALEAHQRGVAWLFGTEGAPPGSRYLTWNLLRGEGPGCAPFLQAKAEPMAFGERMPGPAPLRHALEQATGFISQEPGPLSEQSSWTCQGIRIHPVICSEALLAHRVWKGLDLAGGDLLTNHTNDGWFGDSIASDLHAAQIRLRSCETGLPLLRATLTGRSGRFQADGHWELWSRPMTVDARHVPLAWEPVHTPMRHAAWRLAWAGILALAALLSLIPRQGKP